MTPERLRYLADTGIIHDCHGNVTGALRGAAAEIERLRSENERLRQRVKMWDPGAKEVSSGSVKGKG